MVVLYVKMRAKGTCGVRTRDRSQSDAVPFAGSIYRRTFHESRNWILSIDIQHARAQGRTLANACSSAGAAGARRACREQLLAERAETQGKRPRRPC